ncbi:MAG: hypothetical protein O7G32_07355, partial [SAR324 cluster bacterium]|nr:hypothetical protein [SAR324 cluster bacterium]
MSVIPVAAALSGTDELIQEAEKSLMYVVTRPGNVMVAGKGSYIWDADGRKFLDCIQGWAV